MKSYISNFRITMRIVFSVLIVLILFTESFSRKVETVGILNGAALSTYTPITVEHPKLVLPGGVITNYRFESAVGHLRLEIANSAQFDCSLAAFSATMRINYVVCNINHIYGAPQQIDLNVSYNPNTGALITYDEKNNFAIPNIYGIQVTSYVFLGLSPPLINHLKFSAILEFNQHDENFSQLATCAFLPTWSGIYPDKINVIWNDMPQADEYDLEWKYIDDINDVNYNLPAASRTSFFPLTSLGYNFDNNTTRVTIDGAKNYYTLNNIFEHGYVIFRVRPIYYNGLNFKHRVEGEWSKAPSGIVASNFILNVDLFSTDCANYLGSAITHHPLFNWQYNVTYAEDEKHKEVITYFDGSLRDRQTVTLLNNNGLDINAMIAEGFYDYQGRKTLQSLPTPVLSNTLTYYPDFTRNMSGVNYSKKDFDEDATTNCTNTAPYGNPMSPGSGASQYYSPLNAFIGTTGITDHYKYIPDAANYPFTQLEYTDDPTGRIKRQSGVGLTHKLGSGHETVYMYSSPSQEELDMLFGNNVGNATHYFKSMVRDPNGQLSVNYTDMSGKVVATALAGTAPDNLIKLSNFSSSLKHEDMLKDNHEKMDDIISSYKINVTGNNTSYGINYSVEAESLKLTCGSSSFCFDCVYDLTIDIIEDNCKTHVAGFPLSTTIGSSTNGFHTSCTTPGTNSYNNNWSVSLNIGTYTVIKKLTVNQAAVDYYANLYLSSGCLKTLVDFQQEAIASYANTGCDMDCAKCTTQLGTKSAYVSNRRTEIPGYNDLDAQGKVTVDANSEAEWDEAALKCAELCNQTMPTTCDLKKQQLLADVRPGGRYSKYEIDNAGNYTVSDITSLLYDIYTTTNNSSNFQPAWPLFAVKGNYKYKYVLGATPHESSITYLDKNNVPITINIGGFSKSPSQLTLKEFIDNYQDEWGETLIFMHPEYCKYYHACLETNSSMVAANKFEDDMNAIESYDYALAHGYMNPLGTNTTYSGTTSPIVVDPLFSSTGKLVGEFSTMNNKMTNYYQVPGNIYYFNMWQLVISTYVCHSNISTPVSDWICSQNLTFGSEQCKPFRDMMWEMFRAEYLAERRKLLDTYDSQHNCLPNSPADPRLPAQEERVYPDIASFINSSTTPVITTNPPTAATLSDIDGNIAKTCTTTCESYIIVWQNKLKDCPAYNSLSTNPTNPLGQQAFLNALKDVCIRGCDKNNTMGSRNVSPVNISTSTSPFIPNSFDDVFTHFGISNLDLCDPTILNHPLEYNHNYMAFEDPSGKDCKTCNECKEEIPLENQCVCEKPDPNPYKKLMMAGDEENCNRCIPCEELAKAIQKFQGLYPNGELNDDKNYKQDKLATLLNIHFNFNLNYWEYQDFMVKCVGSVSQGENIRNKFLSQYTTISGSLCKAPQPGDFIHEVKLFEDIQRQNENDLAKIVNQKNNITADASNATLPIKRIISTKDDFYSAVVASGQIPANVCACNIMIEWYNDWEINVMNGSTQSFYDFIELKMDKICGHGGWQFTPNAETFAKDCKSAWERDGEWIASQPPHNNSSDWSDEQIDLLETFIDGSDDGLTGPDCLCSNGEQNSGEVTGGGSSRVIDIKPPLIDISCTELRQHIINFNTSYNGPSEDFYSALEVYLKTIYGATYKYDLQYYLELVKNCYDFSKPPCSYQKEHPCCYRNNEKMQLMQMFLNTLVEDYVPKSSSNYLIKTNQYFNSSYNNNKYVLNYVYTQLFNNSALPPATTDPKYKTTIDNQNYKQIKITIENKDIPAGNIKHSNKIVLTYMGNDRSEFNWARIFKICNITPVEYFYCKKQIFFKVQAYVEMSENWRLQNPGQPDFRIVELYGSVSAYELRTPATCEKLCNRPFLPEVIIAYEPCETEKEDDIDASAERNYNEYIKKEKDLFIEQYKLHCLAAVNGHEVFKNEHNAAEYQYTLYYYDQVGNLIQTIAPKGVVPFNYNTEKVNIENYRKAISNSSGYYPDANSGTYDYQSKYRYNSLNQLIWQKTPDGGETKFWYDRLGRLVLSQNAKQILHQEYSYTLYDELGRAIEVGQLTDSYLDPMTWTHSFNSTYLNTWLTNRLATAEQITQTKYDIVDNSFTTLFPNVEVVFTNGSQQNLRHRVVSTWYLPDRFATPRHATHYSYDIHGNVFELVQQNMAMPTRTSLNTNGISQNYKKLEYDYDLISGNVNQVIYQRNQPDQFMHKYKYDADNHITEALTSIDGHIWDHDAKYFYYKHGPLMRTELGEQQVQGLDNYYTLQGWIKGVNSETLNPSRDEGHDGTGSTSAPGTNPNQWFAKDEFAYSLGYYSGDYNPIGAGLGMIPVNMAFGDASPILNKTKSLYNGNIAYTITSIGKFNSNNEQTLAGVYRYDQLNRLKNADYLFGLDNSTNTWNPISIINNYYHSDFSYDQNGNITYLNRDGVERVGGGVNPLIPKVMDHLSYNYSTTVKDNKLQSVFDNVSSANFSNDIDNQGANNFDYDELGNLIKDVKEDITLIEWTVYGKIKRINFGPTKNMTIEFEYSSTGLRSLKRVTSTTQIKEQYYIYDASGNIIAIYSQVLLGNPQSGYSDGNLIWEESPIYGSGRIGEYKPIKNIYNDGCYPKDINSVLNCTRSIQTRGLRVYELSNHLGNVQVVISDRKIKVCNNTNTYVISFKSEIISATDYYAFGMVMPERNLSINSYRYGFNGQEKDDEVSGNGNTNAAEFWEYDCRLGRRWNIDPIIKYCESGYSCFSNNPIFIFDVNGDDSTKVNGNWTGQWNAEEGDDLNSLIAKFKNSEETLKRWNPNIDFTKPIPIGTSIIVQKEISMLGFSEGAISVTPNPSNQGVIPLLKYQFCFKYDLLSQSGRVVLSIPEYGITCWSQIHNGSITQTLINIEGDGNMVFDLSAILVQFGINTENLYFSNFNGFVASSLSAVAETSQMVDNRLDQGYSWYNWFGTVTKSTQKRFQDATSNSTLEVKNSVSVFCKTLDQMQKVSANLYDNMGDDPEQVTFKGRQIYSPGTPIFHMSVGFTIFFQ